MQHGGEHANSAHQNAIIPVSRNINIHVFFPLWIFHRKSCSKMCRLRGCSCDRQRLKGADDGWVKGGDYDSGSVTAAPVLHSAH